MPIQTHYETLKVARDAPSDVIRAAYKAITQKFNTEHYPSADASRLMKAIHDSYAILSNPVKRSEYDRWLLERESEEVGKGFVDNADKPKSPYSRWLFYAAVVTAIFAALGWLVYQSGSLNNKPEQLPPSAGSTAELDTPDQSAPSLPSPDVKNADNALYAPDFPSSRVPTRDQATIGEFIGTWKGRNGDAAGQQNLDISLKTDRSIVFRLDAKAGQSIGVVYGIAEFENSYAQFYNKEYGCNILFTMKSGILRVDTSSCQEYHEKSVSFDGSYTKPLPVKAELKSAQAKPAANKPEVAANKVNLPVAVEPVPVAPANALKLRKFSATVKDSDGNVNTFELIAKDKEAARAIIRDFRGNPKIVKLKELKK